MCAIDCRPDHSPANPVQAAIRVIRGKTAHERQYRIVRMIRSRLLGMLVIIGVVLPPVPGLANSAEIEALSRFSARKQFHVRMGDLEANTRFSLDADGVSVYIDVLFSGRDERRFLGEAVANFIRHSRDNDVIDCAFEIDADNQPESRPDFMQDLGARLRRGRSLSVLFFSKGLFEQRNNSEDVLGLAKIGGDVSAMGINAVSLKKYFVEDRLYRRQRGELAGLIGHEFMHIMGYRHAGCVFEYRKICDFIYRYGDCIAKKVSGLL